jgi:cytochrome P450
MSTFAFYAIISIILLSIYYFWRRYNEMKRLPPGPWGLPIVGYLPFIDQNQYRMPMQMGNKYGPIFSLQLGQYLVVFLHSYEIAKEAFLKHADVFAGRPKLFWFVYTNKGNGIAPADGEAWKTIRRYTASSLRDFGMGKLSIEGKIHEEIQHLFARIDAQNGKPFRATTMIANAVCNVICSVMYGNR